MKIVYESNAAHTEQYANILASKLNIECISLKNTSELKQINNIGELFFYLQGGVDYSKLKGIKKFMFKMVTDSVIKENKPEDKELIDVLKNGGNLVKEENLSEVLKFLEERI